MLTFLEFLIEKKKNEFEKLKDNQVNLTADERKVVKDRKAEWSDGRSAIWKSVNPKTNTTTYITHTHRAYNTASTLVGACNRFHNFIKGTA